VSKSVVKWSVVGLCVVKILVTVCLTLLDDYRPYEVYCLMDFSFITFFDILYVNSLLLLCIFIIMYLVILFNVFFC
jgi:hypothetical protein